MTYRINGEIVTKEQWDASKKGVPIQPGDKLTIIGAQAYDAFISPIDGSYIDSKHKLNEHNARNDVVQVGNDLVNKGCHGKTREQSIENQNGKL